MSIATRALTIDPNATEKDDRDDDQAPRPQPRQTYLSSCLWPPPCLQAYCLDHFMMECEIYYEQENERYDRLVGRTREIFLADRNKKTTKKPTRRQPARQAKSKNPIQEPTKPQRPPRPKKPSSAPFKPAKLEREFKDSQAGSMLRILSTFHQQLDLHKSWDDYRPALAEKIREAEDRQKAELEKTLWFKGKKAHKNCAFGGPLALECRYCGFAGIAQEDNAVTPRRLAAPAAMHSIPPGDSQEWGVMFRGTNFFVDVCGAKTMIVLVDFRGVLDLCAELFQETEAMPDSPVSLTARLGGIGSRPNDRKAVEAKRRLDELVSSKR